ncbi:MAG TPA: HNH endonuclease, partial [Pedococcus sp.]
HHLVHWADGGASDLDNAALLCGRHHTTVHTRRLAGRLVREGAGTGSGGGRGGDGGGERVEWDLTRGSYDDLLARRAACDTETEPA